MSHNGSVAQEGQGQVLLSGDASFLVRTVRFLGTNSDEIKQFLTSGAYWSAGSGEGATVEALEGDEALENTWMACEACPAGRSATQVGVKSLTRHQAERQGRHAQAGSTRLFRCRGLARGQSRWRARTTGAVGTRRTH